MNEIFSVSYVSHDVRGALFALALEVDKRPLFVIVNLHLSRKKLLLKKSEYIFNGVHFMTPTSEYTHALICSQEI